jgi:Na+-driven multidrug efflux pump
LVLILIFLLYNIVGTNFLTKLRTLEASRSLITFLFGITTVCISLIVVLTALLGSGDKEERAMRFQQGKDILTVLIGVFGTIIGFYFGAAKPQSEKQQSESDTTTENAQVAESPTSTRTPKTKTASATPTGTSVGTPTEKP